MNIRIPTTLRQSLPVSIWLGCMWVVFALVSQMPQSKALLSGVVFSLLSLALLYWRLHNRLYLPLQRIHQKIEKTLEGGQPRSIQNGREPGLLESLDFAVGRLVSEKTSEIDTLKSMEMYRREFLGNVAHELRSPLFNVAGYLHTLLDGAMEDEEVREKFIRKAANNADHLSSLVEDLVTISRLESGQLRLDKNSFDLKELVHEVLESAELSAKARQITLDLKESTIGGSWVLADRGRIRQVLLNLVTNSIKYGKEGGHTRLTLEDVGRDLLIEVSDNGEGIASDHLPRIFERFYRADKARARGGGDSPSTGLGLAIVKHLVEAHGHKIVATSREGVGSIFSFMLTKVAPAPVQGPLP